MDVHPALNPHSYALDGDNEVDAAKRLQKLDQVQVNPAPNLQGMDLPTVCSLTVETYH